MVGVGVTVAVEVGSESGVVGVLVGGKGVLVGVEVTVAV
jgi:hypothetical protein